MRLTIGGALGAAMVMALPLTAQTTGPSFNAPYRAFARSEFGATMVFPDGGGTQIEGQYRFGQRTWDIGLRGGVFFPGGAADEQLVAGVIARNRVITHSESFPLDGAAVFGGGLRSGGGTQWQFPFGISLGRRLDVEGSDISIVPYVQPTIWLFAGNGTTDHLGIGAGFGADFRLSQVFDARVSVGVGENRVEGVSISAVWVH